MTAIAQIVLDWRGNRNVAAKAISRHRSMKHTIASLLRSRVVAAVGYAILAILGITYIYHWYTSRDASSRELNISCFAYRDINRNGRYDTVDRPYAGLQVTLRRPDGRNTSTCRPA